MTEEEAREFGVHRPLAETTLRRIAAGLRRYVLDAPNPFIVPITNTSSGPGRARSTETPLGTVTTAKGGEFALVAPHVSLYRANAVGHDAREPVRTITTAHSETHPGGAAPIALVSAHIDRQFGRSIGGALVEPLGTTTAGGSGKSALVTAFIAQHNGVPGGVNPGRNVTTPLSTIGTLGANQTPVEVTLSPTTDGRRAEDVRAFLVKYYGASDEQGQDLRDALHTVTTRDRFGLVTVAGIDYEITDISIRMLRPRELFDAMGFPHDYIIDRGEDGRRLSQAAQIRMCGNAVCPPWAAAIVGANVPELARVATDERGAAG